MKRQVYIEYVATLGATLVKFADRRKGQRYLAGQFFGQREQYAQEWAEKKGYQVIPNPAYNERVGGTNERKQTDS